MVSRCMRKGSCGVLTLQAVLRRLSWGTIDGDFQQTMKRLRHLSQTVDSQADAARMLLDLDRNAEILDVMQSLKSSKISTDILPCYHLPSGITDRFYGREDLLQLIRIALSPSNTQPGIKSAALYGLGGVGKTQTALRYANASRESFDAILWISADNSIKMAQSFLEVAQRLGIIPSKETVQDPAAAVAMVKAWLAETTCRWLVIFDNADELSVLKNAWPGSGTGSVLITSRDFSASFSPASQGFQVKPFDPTTGAQVLLSLMNRDPSQPDNISAAKNITDTLGGLPLALNQISGFIVQQRLSLKDFLALYERNSAKILAKKSRLSEYEHSVSTVWEMALKELSGDAGNLQRLLAFFDPDRIHESILNVDASIGDDSFLFLSDEMELVP